MYAYIWCSSTGIVLSKYSRVSILSQVITYRLTLISIKPYHNNLLQSAEVMTIHCKAQNITIKCIHTKKNSSLFIYKFKLKSTLSSWQPTYGEERAPIHSIQIIQLSRILSEAAEFQTRKCRRECQAELRERTGNRCLQKDMLSINAGRHVRLMVGTPRKGEASSKGMVGVNLNHVSGHVYRC